MLVMSVSGSSLRPDLAQQAAAFLRTAFQSMTPNFACSLPRKMFSAIDSSGTSASSWWMMTMPTRLAVVDAVKAAFLAHIVDVAVIGAVRIDAGEHLHQRRFAGAVLADDGVDLAGTHVQIDVLKGLHTRKSLGDAAHLQDRLVHRLALARFTDRPASVRRSAPPHDTKVAVVTGRAPRERGALAGCHCYCRSSALM